MFVRLILPVLFSVSEEDSGNDREDRNECSRDHEVKQRAVPDRTTIRRTAPVEDGSGQIHAIRHLHHGREQSQEATGMMNRDEDAREKQLWEDAQEQPHPSNLRVRTKLRRPRAGHGIRWADADGRIFVNFPRWDDPTDFTLAELREQPLHRYPTAQLQHTHT